VELALRVLSSDIDLDVELVDALLTESEAGLVLTNLLLEDRQQGLHCSRIVDLGSDAQAAHWVARAVTQILVYVQVDVPLIAGPGRCRLDLEFDPIRTDDLMVTMDF
jgi:hypothetical protein